MLASNKVNISYKSTYASSMSDMDMLGLIIG